MPLLEHWPSFYYASISRMLRETFNSKIPVAELFIATCTTNNGLPSRFRARPPEPQNNHRWWTYPTPPLLIEPHKPVIVINLNNIQSLRGAAQNKQRVLILTPLHDAARYIHRYFELIVELTYPHELIDLGFLVGDTKDETLALLTTEADQLQRGEYAVRSIQVISRDFGQSIFQDTQEKHSFAAQAPRRKLMAKARNYLLYTTLKPDHSWVFWRDVDVEESPPSILEDFMSHDKDVLVPSMCDLLLSLRSYLPLLPLDILRKSAIGEC